jgi:hypothetical protein
MAEHPSDPPPPPTATLKDALALLARAVGQLPGNALLLDTSPCGRFELVLARSDRWLTYEKTFAYRLFVRSVFEGRPTTVSGLPFEGTLARAMGEASTMTVSWPDPFAKEEGRPAISPLGLPKLLTPEEMICAILPALVGKPKP